MIKKAIGVKYNKDEDNAPKVITKGAGEIAEKIIKKAEEYGISVMEDKNLAEILYKLEVPSEIPEELYGVMAEILMYVYEVDKKRVK